jgi:hypothetical protein
MRLKSNEPSAAQLLEWAKQRFWARAMFRTEEQTSERGEVNRKRESPSEMFSNAAIQHSA